jgi:hypothetical protein
MKKPQKIGAIYKTVPDIFPCNDGTFTTSKTKRGCTRHGGKASDTPLKFGNGGSSKLNIKDVPLNEINVDKALFQGREKAFSIRSVENIVEAVKSGQFVWANLDPITLWENPNGKLFLISGHSRFEAFKRLVKDGQKADNKDFEAIPAKILKGELSTAKKTALESNTLSTKETDIERAKYYRRLRQDGQDEKKTVEAMKKNEGKNWVNIYAYTFLNPDGKTMAGLKQFIENEDTSAVLSKSLSKWIGSARKNYPQLTNEHEDELYNWVFNQKGYGTGSGAVSNEREFLEKVQMFVAKNTFFGQFEADKPLNILQQLYKSPVEQEYDEQLDEAKKNVLETEKELKQKIKSLSDRGATKTEIQKIVEPFETRLRNQRITLQKLIAKKSEIAEYAKKETTLFGISGTRRTKRREISYNPFKC